MIGGVFRSKAAGSVVCIAIASPLAISCTAHGHVLLADYFRRIYVVIEKLLNGNPLIFFLLT
jgi:hypothetical protein